MVFSQLDINLFDDILVRMTVTFLPSLFEEYTSRVCLPAYVICLKSFKHNTYEDGVSFLFFCRRRRPRRYHLLFIFIFSKKIHYITRNSDYEDKDFIRKRIKISSIESLISYHFF
jgi:hypothetical protein